MLPTECISKYHREIPIRAFNPDQAFYSIVMEVNADNMDLNYCNYFGKTKTFVELRHETDSLASALVNAGVKSGDVVGVCILTIPETAPILLAINKIGATSFWLDARTKHDDIVHYVSECNIRHVIVIEPVLPAFMGIEGLQKIVLHPMNTLGIQPESINTPTDDLMSYRDFLYSGLDTPVPPVDYKSDRPAVIVQSSGSTGKSKAIIHTSFNINSQITRCSYHDVPFYKGQKSLICVPPWIIYGLVNSMYSGLVFGMETIFTLEYKEDVVFNALGDFTFCYGVPVCYRYIYDRMRALLDENTPDSLAEFKALRKKISIVDTFISGGDKLPQSEHIKWQLMMDAPIINGYGNNEIVGAAVLSPFFANRPGSIGVAMYGTIVKTFDSETQKILPDGKTGEIIISSDAMFVEYLNNPEETQRIKQLHDGRWWVHTGDLGSINEDGFVTLTGRSKRLIIDKLGYKISPENSENFIMKLPHVKECVVVGVDLEPNNKVPMAFIELDCADKTGRVLAKIEKSCSNGVLKDYERPKLFKVIDSMPHSTNGGKRDFLALDKMAMEFIELRRQEANSAEVKSAPASEE